MNKEERAEYMRNWQKENRSKLNKYQRKWRRKRATRDPEGAKKAKARAREYAKKYYVAKKERIAKMAERITELETQLANRE